MHDDVESALETLAIHFKKHGNARSPKTEIFASRFDEHETALTEAEAVFALPADLRNLYQLCDGFVGPEMTYLHGLEEIIESLRRYEVDDKGLSTIVIGDGCDLCDREIFLMHGKHFKDAEAKIVVHDWRHPELNTAFEERFTTQSRPLWEDMEEEPVGELFGSVMGILGPLSVVEFLEYVRTTTD